MLKELIAKTAVLAFLVPNLLAAQTPANGRVLASHQMTMWNRYPVQSVSNVFADNILLTVYYFINGRDSVSKKPDWDDVKKPFDYSLTLNPGEVFAFHETALPEYKNRVRLTTNSRFAAADGYKSDGLLFGDGVCHLASLMYWVALDAGLETKSLVNHNFAKIEGVEKKYGVSIKFDPNSPVNSARQNLYITNNRQNPVVFRFVYQNDTLSFSISEVN